MKYSYVVRLKSDGRKPEEYYFEEYKDAWAFMLRCKGHGSKCELEEVDFITVRSDALYENVLDSE